MAYISPGGLSELYGVQLAAHFEQARFAGARQNLGRLLPNCSEWEAPAPLACIPDGHDVSYLPGWVKAPKQVTEGHLSHLAKANGALLATLDENIPGSYLIPE